MRDSTLPGKKRKWDMICMASYGRRGLSRLVMGSVTQNVLSQLRAAGGGVPLTCVGLCSHSWL
ncbi:universal stress protein [Porticoccus sp.]|uniref:universal stress protein n=1 Tax=Porticoccus sp. TaxID=2024853 RepID=UPI0039E3C2BF